MSTFNGLDIRIDNCDIFYSQLHNEFSSENN